MRRDHPPGGRHHQAEGVDRLEDVVDVGQPGVGDEQGHGHRSRDRLCEVLGLRAGPGRAQV